MACIKCVLQERRVNAGQPITLWEALLELLQEHHQDERPGIVVSAVAVLVVGKRIDGVLQHSGVIRQAYEMIQPPDGQRRPAWSKVGASMRFAVCVRVLVTRAFESSACNRAPHATRPSFAPAR